MTVTPVDLSDMRLGEIYFLITNNTISKVIVTCTSIESKIPLEDWDDDDDDDDEYNPDELISDFIKRAPVVVCTPCLCQVDKNGVTRVVGLENRLFFRTKDDLIEYLKNS